jgi:methyl-accepting chemotaxis protein
MRLTLRKQITTALVLFGLVPAFTVAYFAYRSNDDAKDKQDLIIRQVADSISERMAPLISSKLGQADNAAKGQMAEVKFNEDEKNRARQIVTDVVTDFDLNTVQVFLVTPDDHYVLVRRGNRSIEFLERPLELDPRYAEKAKGVTTAITKENERSSTNSFIESWFTDSNPAEVLGLAPIHVASAKAGDAEHGWLTLVAVPRREAYATIYNNQLQLEMILLLSLLLIALLARYFGRWFVRPVHEIIDVTRKLQDGQLYNRTNVKRGDELGDLAIQVNSVVDKWAELISQIRTMTASVSTASNELNSSAHQLAQGSSEQAATLQQIAGSLQSVDASVGRNAQHARDTARMANEASAQAEKGGEAVRETVVAMREITQKILIVDDIAYQTNLLALNAAIEAARAGAHGKGFAVVAGEVRKLAERSQAAAQQISDLAKKSVAVAENAGTLLDRTVPQIRDTSHLIQEIAAASQEQMNAIREINLGVSQLEEVVQQNAAASHELSGTSNDLAAHSTSLQQKVDFFQLDTSGNGYFGAGPPARPSLGQGLRAPAPLPRRLAATRQRPNQGLGIDGQHAASSMPATPPALSQNAGSTAGPGGSSNNMGTPQRGGVVVNLDDDDNFERFS